MAATWLRLGPRSMQSVQALTEAAPTGDDGVLLEGVAAVVPVIHAPVGQTFTGAGRLLGYTRRSGVWVRAPRADVPLDEIAGLQDSDLPPLTVTAQRDKFALIANGIVLSGGAQVTLEFLCLNRPAWEVT